MSLYLNSILQDGSRTALELATTKGWSDFVKWAKGSKYKLLKELAETGTAPGSKEFEDECKAASKSKINKSAGAVLNRLIEICPLTGRMAVSDEPLED